MNSAKRKFLLGFVSKCALYYFPLGALVAWFSSRKYHDLGWSLFLPLAAAVLAIFVLLCTVATLIFRARPNAAAVVQSADDSDFRKGWRAADIGMWLA